MTSAKRLSGRKPAVQAVGGTYQRKFIAGPEAGFEGVPHDKREALVGEKTGFEACQKYER